MNHNTQLALQNSSIAKLRHTRLLQKASNTNRVLRTASTASPTSSYLTRSPNRTGYSDVVTADDMEKIKPHENTTTTTQELQHRTLLADDYSALASSTKNAAAKSQQTCHPIIPHLTTSDTRLHHTGLTAAASTSAYRQNQRRSQTTDPSKGEYWLYCGSWIEC